MYTNSLTDTSLKIVGMRVLSEKFGLVDAERFIMLMNRDPFDYTEWQRGLFAEMTLEELNERAAAYRRVLNSVKQQELD